MHNTNNYYVDSAYHVDCVPLKEVREIKSEWEALEAESECPFFLSYCWIGAWLETYQPDGFLIKVSHQNITVGLGILVKSVERRFVFVHSRQLLLHQTGDANKDQIWIEYNGFLTHKEHAGTATQAALTYIQQTFPTAFGEWDELQIGAVVTSTAKLFEETLALQRYTLWQAPCYGIDLAQLRTQNTPYLSTLSRNSRYQIRHSERQYSDMGPVMLEKAKDVDSALQYFDAIAPLHKKRWGIGPHESGFANPHFVTFHQNLIRLGWQSGNIDLVRLRVGDEVVSYFYNFLYRKRVYFYLSGLQFDDNPKCKPGLLGHAVCIQQYIDGGFDYYDFMGGGERYKASMGHHSDDITHMRLQQPRLRLKLENGVRRLKQRLLDSRYS